ncbi:hypothetical protein GOBAR_DD05492 [Gossypium barbadense]|nr:hypothetical protein GOBAR_DD05492 [Gossypium barbadense]
MSNWLKNNNAWKYRSLFVLNEDQVLEFFPPQIHDGLVTIKPPVDVIEEGEWMSHGCLVFVHFVIPLGNLIKAALIRIRGRYGSLSASVASSYMVDPGLVSDVVKVVEKLSFVGSSNRFDVFNLALDDCDGFDDVPALDEASKQMIHSPKKPRVASKEVIIDVRAVYKKKVLAKSPTLGDSFLGREILSFWNVRRLNNPLKQRQVIARIQKL